MEWIPKKERLITDHKFLESVKIRGGSKYIYFYDSTSSLRILYPLIRTSKTFHVFSFWFCMNVSVTNSPRAERYKPVLQLSGIVCHFSRTSVFVSLFESISLLLVLRCRFGSFTVEEGTWSSPLPSRRWAFMFFFCFVFYSGLEHLTLWQMVNKTWEKYIVFIYFFISTLFLSFFFFKG